MTRSPDEQWIPEETLGDRLRRVRRAVGLGQAPFAERLGDGLKAYSSWEAGIREPRNVVALAKRIEMAFGVPAAWTLGVEMQNTPGPRGPEGGPAAGEGGALLPRLDSNQQPSGIEFAQVSVGVDLPDAA